MLIHICRRHWRTLKVTINKSRHGELDQLCLLCHLSWAWMWLLVGSLGISSSKVSQDLLEQQLWSFPQYKIEVSLSIPLFALIPLSGNHYSFHKKLLFPNSSPFKISKHLNISKFISCATQPTFFSERSQAKYFLFLIILYCHISPFTLLLYICLSTG